MPGSPDDGEWLRQYLATHDLSCVTCGYNLRGLDGTRCPECDAEANPTVLFTVQWTPSYIATLAALLLGCGAAAMVLFTLLLTRSIDLLLYLGGISAAMLSISATILVVLISTPIRRHFYSMHPWKRRGAVLAAYLILSVYLVMYAAWLVRNV